MFTPKYIIKLMARCKEDGDCAHGAYFYCPDGLIVERVTRDVITRAVADLLDTGDFFSVLKLLDND